MSASNILFFTSMAGSIMFLFPTRVISPYPSNHGYFSLNTAIEGIGNPPSSRAFCNFSIVMLCTVNSFGLVSMSKTDEPLRMFGYKANSFDPNISPNLSWSENKSLSRPFCKNHFSTANCSSIPKFTRRSS